MRVLRDKLSPEEEELVLSLNPELQGISLRCRDVEGVFVQDIFSDLVSSLEKFSNKAVYLSSKDIKKMTAGLKEEAKERKWEIRKTVYNFFDVRESLIKIIDSNLLKRVRKLELTVKQKGEVTMRILENILSPYWTRNKKNQAEKIKEDFKNMVDYLNNIVLEEEEETQEVRDKEIEKLFNKDKEDKEDDGDNDNKEYSGEEVGKGTGKEKNMKKYAEIINLLSGDIDKKAKVFSLAKTLDEFLERRDFGEYKDAKIGNSKRIRKMRNLADTKYIKGIDFALPDEVFDMKLLKRNFIVEQPVERKDRKQYLNILIDTSGSVSDTQMVFQLAITVALGRFALKTGGKIAFRFFSDEVSDLVILEEKKDWSNFISVLLGKTYNGGTALYNSMLISMQDIIEGKLKDHELLVMTDATRYFRHEEIEPLKSRGIKTHFILIRGEGENNADSALIENYKKVSENILDAPVNSYKDAEKIGIKFVSLV